MKLSVGIHQPNFLPWFGFFHKIHLSDIFILHDNIEYSKKSVLRRTHIRNINIPLEKEYLTIPLVKCSDFTLIKDLVIDHSQKWTPKILNKIKNTYSKTPYFADYFTDIEEWIKASQDHTNLSNWTCSLIEQISSLLSITTKFQRSSELQAQGKGNEYNLNMTKELGGNIYCSGAGAEGYQMKEDFEKENIALNIVNSFEYIDTKKYPQNGLSFLNGLSIIDLLFNVGEEGVMNLLKEYAEISWHDRLLNDQ